MRTATAIIIAALGLLVGGNALLAAEMPALAKKNECDACHAIDKKVVGPAWMTIAKKYKRATKYMYGGREYALEDGLVMKVSQGGSGNWGAMPMPPNDSNGQNQADMRALVRFVLSLAK